MMIFGRNKFSAMRRMDARIEQHTAHMEHFAARWNKTMQGEWTLSTPMWIDNICGSTENDPTSVQIL